MTDVFPDKTKQKSNFYQLHIFIKGKTKEGNKIPERRIKVQQGMLRIYIGISVSKTSID